MSENALAIRPASAMEEWERAKQWGEYAARTGIVKNQYEGAIKAYAAYELGITAIAAANGLYIIDSEHGAKPSQSPELVLGRMLVHPEFAGCIEKRLTNALDAFYGWEITLRRQKSNGVVIEATRRFTVDDSARIVYNKGGDTLSTKSNYKNYGENMHYWRAMSFAQSVVWADLTLGIKQPDELGAITDQSGNFIDVAPRIVAEAETPSPMPPAPAIPQYGLTLARLMELAASDEILAANDGSFPVTPKQINIVAHRLIEAGKMVDPNASQPEA